MQYECKITVSETKGFPDLQGGSIMYTNYFYGNWAYRQEVNGIWLFTAPLTDIGVISV